jgi:uncharacterized membrane protein YdbT with pleckstrin-like domain
MSIVGRCVGVPSVLIDTPTDAAMVKSVKAHEKLVEKALERFNERCKEEKNRAQRLNVAKDPRVRAAAIREHRRCCRAD